MATSVNYPQSLYFDREVNNGNISRKLYVFYKETSTSTVIQKKVFDIVTNERIKISTNANSSSMTITENSAAISGALVKSTIRFETNEGESPNQGRIEGGLFSNEDSSNANCDCSTIIEGYEYDTGTISPSSYPLFIANQDELILSIIGVDDIRAKTDGNYNETYALEGQELSFMLEPVGTGTNFNILIEYNPL